MLETITPIPYHKQHNIPNHTKPYYLSRPDLVKSFHFEVVIYAIQCHIPWPLREFRDLFHPLPPPPAPSLLACELDCLSPSSMMWTVLKTLLVVYHDTSWIFCQRCRFLDWGKTPNWGLYIFVLNLARYISALCASCKKFVWTKDIELTGIANINVNA